MDIIQSHLSYLCYYSPQTFLLDENPEKLEKVLLEDGFYLPFSAHIEKVEIRKEEIIEPLLGEVREIWDMEEAPERREDCEDCRRVEWHAPRKLIQVL